MKARRIRLEACGVGFGECSSAVSTSRRDREGQVDFKAASAGELKKQRTLLDC